MSADYPDLPHGSAWAAARVYYPAHDYHHPPTGLVQLRVVRRGSSYADIDLGLGARRVFTRPGDLLLSLPDRPTLFRIDEGRELTLLQVTPALASKLIRQAGGHSLNDLTPLLRRPVRDPLVGELLRRLEFYDNDTAIAQQWALGVVFASLLRLAANLAARSKPAPLSEDALTALLARVQDRLAEPWTVEGMATEVGLPRRTFAAAFKAAKGMPVHQYLLRMRADRAVHLLRSTDLPITDVAQRAGFAHQAHMTRVLNRLKRATPAQIRAAP